MRIVRRRPNIAMTETALEFSAAEKKTLLAAREIAAKARRLCAEHVGQYEWEADSQDLLLAEIEHNVSELVNGVILSDEAAPLF